MKVLRFIILCFPLFLNAQKKTVEIFTGIVIDSQGNPISEVDVENISFVGEITKTKLNGEFSLKASVGDKLILHSYDRYSQIVKIKQNDKIFIYDDALIKHKKTSNKSRSISRSESEKNRMLPCVENSVRLIGKDKYDSRFEKYQLDTIIKWQRQISERAKSIAMIVHKKMLYQISPVEYELDSYNTLGDHYKLCDNESFTDQSIIGIGTGFIIDKNKMATANHVFQYNIEEYRVVFGYEIKDKLKGASVRFFMSDVYLPKKINVQSYELDMVVFEVDRDFDRPVLEWENSIELPNKNEIYMIGHPLGLPLKIALNADITDNKHNQYFYTSLDSFQGNSGSPIFDFCTNKVIGVLVSGELDFYDNGHCNKSTLCKFPYCEGEKVIRIEQIMGLLPYGVMSKSE